MRNFWILIFFILCTTQAFGWGSPKPREPLPTSSPILGPYVSISMSINAPKARKDRIERLVRVVHKIVNSSEFKDRVLGAYWNGKPQFYGETKSNLEVYQAILNGQELNTTADGEWDLQIGVEWTRCSTLGWTYPNTRMFWFNSCGFDKRSDSGIAGTICHEYSHKLGFTHDFKKTPYREYSVPYAIGNICAELYPKYL